MTSLARFLQLFEVDEGASPVPDGGRLSGGIDGAAILALVGGRSFNLGAFRTFSTESSKDWNDVISDAFPAYKGIIRCIGFGWDGQVIAEVLRDREDIERGVAIFNPNTAETLNAPVSIVDFMNDMIGDDEEDVLEAGLYLTWLKADKTPVQIDECVGYDVPMFVGGDQSMENMNVIDFEVYWDISRDLIKKYFDAEDGDAIAI